jgi:chemotaxis protein MotC
MRAAWVVAAALSLWSGVAVARADEFVDLVRKLTSLQDGMARGAAAARAAIPGQVERIQTAIATAEADSWKERANARAAATYLLSGGSPRGVRKIFDAHLFSDADRPLVEASLAYAEGRSRDAAPMLAQIEPKEQPATLGGHLALVRGGLLIGSDNARARELLDLARLLMPSSLVEEAALRREVAILDPQQDAAKFLLLARRYVAQYSRSPFARNFWGEVRAATMRVALSVSEQQLGEFLALFDAMPAPMRFDLHMTIAQNAILHGRPALAALETDRAATLADTREAKARIALNRAALTALGGDFDAAASEFAELDAKSLGPSDMELRAVVAGAIDHLRLSPDTAESTMSARDELASERAARQALADSEIVLQKAVER